MTARAIVAGFMAAALLLASAAIFAPAGTPEAIVTRLSEEAAKAIASSEIEEKLTSLGMETMSGSRQSFARLNADELDRWRRVVKSANIKGD